MKIKSFVFLLNLIVLVILTIFIYSLYNQQQHKLITLISDNVKKELQDTSYIATKFLNKSNQIYSLRAVLDRKIAEDKLIKGFILAQNNKPILISGDVNLKIPPADNIKYNINNITFEDILNKKAFVINISFYIQNQKQNYNLYLFLDKSKLNTLIVDLRNKYLILYLIIISIIFLTMHYLVQYYLINPLIQIENFAKRKAHEPKDSLIKELNSIKNAISISFHKLDSTIDNLYKSTITDHLTRLGNKNYLIKEIQKLINENNEKFCVVFLDLDNFKELNDFYGHSIGDELIIEVSETLKKFIKQDEVLTRIGGDEFVLVLKECELNNIKKRINFLLQLLNQQWVIREQELTTSASIGVTIYPDDGNSSEELLKNADIAMYEAKKHGKNDFVIFNNKVKQDIDKMFILKNKLKKAIENNEFELYFQPKLDINEKIIGCEALIRWNSEDGVVSPALFIPLAEKSGLIYEIGKWVIFEAFKQVKKWEENKYLKNLSIAFNVSVVQMKHEHFLIDIEDAIETVNPNIANLDMEITESVFMANKQKSIHLLTLIRDMGFRIDLDDFGTGYSSLSVLKEFHIDVLKIDKSFIDEITYDQGKIYVKTIIDMAKNLHIKTVAEGVETKEQVDILKELGIDIFQGYYFAKPLQKEEFEKFAINNLKKFI